MRHDMVKQSTSRVALPMFPSGENCLQSDCYAYSPACETYKADPVLPPCILTADLVHAEDALLDCT